MARPRLHSLDELLDIAEQLVTSGDPAGLTLRSLATGSGASNGTIYHAFRSKEDLLARLWLRASERLGAILEEAVGSAHGEEAVVAASVAPVTFARRHQASAQLFFAQRSDQLFSADLPAELGDTLAREQRRFRRLLADLAVGIWDRKDRPAVEAVATCVVDVPGGILRRALIDGRRPDPATERRIEAAVRAILAVPLDPPRTRSPR
ncbi:MULTISPECIES: TetR/AcrR family transcriptional regulator [unclassified Nocardioides]|uniref:TetR/AcrR family transcriptional regulator n=1 Tax=unclassified Nocardioides TaxID=2615069 RepID=UPI003613229F